MKLRNLGVEVKKNISRNGFLTSKLKLPEIEERIRNKSPQRNSSETEEIPIKMG